jgi:curved DNA binding protein
MSDDSSHDEDDQIEEEDPGLGSPQVVDKYKDAANIANRVMMELIGLSVPGASVFELCGHGDKLIEDMVAQVHTKVKSKGVAFPTSISVNNCCGNYSPLTLNESISLQQSDVVKIDIGVHIDGYISTVAHTIVVGTFEGPITGIVADVICAAYFASECALRLIRPGKTNTEVTNTILKVSNVFKVTPLQGVLSHEISKNTIDGKRVIINKFEVDQVVDEFQFELNQAYTIDIVMSTGEGKTRQIDSKPSIYKRNKDVSYSLKSKASRTLLNDIKKKNGLMPFNIKNFEVRSRVGIKELLTHDLVSPYPVMYEKNNQIVARFKFTVLILGNSTQKLNEGFQLPWVTSDFKLESDPQLSQIMSMSLKRNKKKKKKKITKNQNNQQNNEQNNEPNEEQKDDGMDTS